MCDFLCSFHQFSKIHKGWLCTRLHIHSLRFCWAHWYQKRSTVLFITKRMAVLKIFQKQASNLPQTKWQHFDSVDFRIILSSGPELYTFRMSLPILESRYKAKIPVTNIRFNLSMLWNYLAILYFLKITFIYFVDTSGPQHIWKG